MTQSSSSARAAPSEAETHIAGVLIHARPEYIADIALAVSMLPKACVTHQTEDGRAVAVLEAGSAREVAQQLDGIRSLRGVLNVAPVYQHAEAEDEMNKEMDA
jgi:periplasmic nitrate reductase NapD